MPQIEHEPHRSMSCELLRMQGLEPDDDAIAGPGGSDVEADASGGGGELGGQENITVSAVTPPLHRDKPAAHARSHTTGPGGARQDSAPDTERFMESFRLVMGTIAPAHLRAVRPQQCHDIVYVCQRVAITRACVKGHGGRRRRLAAAASGGARRRCGCGERHYAIHGM